MTSVSVVVVDNFNLFTCIGERNDFEVKVFNCFVKNSLEHIQRYFLPNLLKTGKVQVSVKSRYRKKTILIY
jgi:hypothetical protein